MLLNFKFYIIIALGEIMNKQCELYDRECINCKECLTCDLNPLKICDNCGKCIGEGENDYKAIKITEIKEK